MSLITRLFKNDIDATDSISVEGFYSSLMEFAEGALTRQNIIDGWVLLGDDITDLDWMIAQYNGTPPGQREAYMRRIRHVFTLAEQKIFGYDDEAVIIARLTA